MHYSSPYRLQLAHGHDQRIIGKRESVTGKPPGQTEYAYDQAGCLEMARVNGNLSEFYEYDGRGRRIRSGFGADAVVYEYAEGRLVRVGRYAVTHDEHGFRSGMETDLGLEVYEYSPDYRLLRIKKADGTEIGFRHDSIGRRAAKYVNGTLVEEYGWTDAFTLAWCRTLGVRSEFQYGRGRLPVGMRRNGQFYRLFYDQVGSLRVVATASGKVIKENVYDSFGRIIEDTDPAFSLPLGFAGGLHDRDAGWVRFGFRDYDPVTGRFTARDPLGQAGGDTDVYGYCLDDPVNLIDPKGLFAEIPESSFVDQGGEIDGLNGWVQEIDISDSLDGEPHTTYWTVHPKPKACDKCRAMANKVYREKPERPHPNCKCEIRRHVVEGYDTVPRQIHGTIEDFKGSRTERFHAFGPVQIKVISFGPAWYPAIDIQSNNAPRQGSHISIGSSLPFELIPQDDTIQYWEIKLTVEGAENARFDYTIYYRKPEGVTLEKPHDSDNRGFRFF